MRVWQGKLRLCGHATREGISPGKEVDARIIVNGNDVTLETSESNDMFGKPRWQITEMQRLHPLSLLRTLAGYGDEIDASGANTKSSNPVRLTNC